MFDQKLGNTAMVQVCGNIKSVKNMSKIMDQNKSCTNDTIEPVIKKKFH